MNLFVIKNLRSGTYLLKGALLCMILIGVIACSDISDAERIKNAEVYMAEGSYSAAVIELKNAIQANAKNKDFRFLLAQIYLKSGEGVNAEKELRQAERLGMDHAVIIVPLGQALVLQGMYKKALTTLQSDAGKENKIKILLLTGDAYLGLSDFKQAENAYLMVNKIDPANVESLLGLARISVKHGNFTQVEGYLDKIKHVAPDNINLALFRANLHMLKGRHAEAEASFKRALELDKEKDFTRRKFQALAGIAMSQILQENLDAASASIDILTKASSQHPRVRYLQGWLAFQKKNYELANSVLLELQGDAPNYIPGLLLLGASSYALGNYEQANIYLSRFVNAVPMHIQGRKLLAATQLKLNQPEKAMAVLQANIVTTDAELMAMVGQAAALTGNTTAHISYLKDIIKKSPDNILLRKELVKAYMQQGSLNDAIAELESLHKKGGQDQSTDLLLIYAQLRAGNINSARSLAEEMLQKKPSDPDLHAVTGVVELAAGNRKLARKHFNVALTRQKNHISSQLSLARMELEDGNLDEASNWFEKILSEDKTLTVAILGQAQIAAQQGNMKKVLSLLEKARRVNAEAVLPRTILTRYYLATRKADLALELANEVNSLQPDSGNSLLLLGRAYMLAKQMQNAVNIYQKLVVRQPSAIAYMELAVAQRALGELASAHDSLKKSLQQNSKYLQAKILLIDIELNLNQLAKALKLANEIKQQYSDKNIGYLLEGDIYMQQKRYKDAQRAFKLAKKKEPGAKSILKLSQSYLLAGEKDEALLTLTRGVAKYPDDFELRLRLATHQQFIGNLASAEDSYTKLLEKQPSNIIVLNNLASLLAEKKPEKALMYAKQAYQQAPKNMAVADTFGWLLINTGKVKKGLEILTDAITYGDNPTVKYHLAVALVKNGKGVEAVTILNTLAKSGVKFAEQKEAATLLASLK